jgi:hypothetical protein
MLSINLIQHFLVIYYIPAFLSVIFSILLLAKVFYVVVIQTYSRYPYNKNFTDQLDIDSALLPHIMNMKTRNNAIYLVVILIRKEEEISCPQIDKWRNDGSYSISSL